MKKFKVNEYITLKLKRGKTNIYVNGKHFIQCKFLMLNIPLKEVKEFDGIESIDEMADILGWTEEGQEGVEYEIDPETEFWGHCSNLQAWVENEYNTSLMHSNLAFPLLEQLNNAGDIIAKRVFKREIAIRFRSNNKKVIIYLLKEGYFKYLNSEEISSYLRIKMEEALESKDLSHNIKVIAYLIAEGYHNCLNSEEFELILHLIKEKIVEYIKEGDFKNFLDLSFILRKNRELIFQNNEYEDLLKNYNLIERMDQKYQDLGNNNYLDDLLRLEDVINIINRKDMGSFVPILGTGILFDLGNERLYKLIIDPKTTLLNSIILAITKYEDKLQKYLTEDNDRRYDYLFDNLFVFEFPKRGIVNFRESVIGVLKDPRINNYSFLIKYGLIRSVDYENLLRTFENPKVFRNFLKNLYQEFNENDEWKRYGIPPYSPFYEDIGYHFIDSLTDIIIEFSKENDWTFLIMLETLNWYQFFTSEKLKEIIYEKYIPINHPYRSRINFIVRDIHNIIFNYDLSGGDIKKDRNLSFVKYKGIKYFIRDGVLFLRELGIEDISEIERLESMTDLTTLDLSDNYIKEIKGLESLINLKVLKMERNQINEIKGLDALVNLREISLFYNEILEIKGFNSLTNLKRLNLGHNKIKEIKSLENLTSLEELFLVWNQISKIEGLKMLSKLRVLNIWENHITELEGLEELYNLKTLILERNQIKEIKSLDNLYGLERLFLEKNKISEIKGLESLENLQELGLGGNPISKVLFKQLGGIHEHGRVNEPRRFVEYCKLKKNEQNNN